MACGSRHARGQSGDAPLLRCSPYGHMDVLLPAFKRLRPTRGECTVHNLRLPTFLDSRLTSCCQLRFALPSPSTGIHASTEQLFVCDYAVTCGSAILIDKRPTDPLLRLSQAPIAVLSKVVLRRARLYPDHLRGGHNAPSTSIINLWKALLLKSNNEGPFC